jgi:hypothetical protein
MGTGHPDWFKGIVLYGIGPEDEFIPIRTDELGNLHVGYGTHAITHQDGGSDEISVEGLEGILSAPQKAKLVYVGAKAGFPDPSISGRLAYATDEGLLYYDDVTSWEKAGAAAFTQLTDTPSSYTDKATYILAVNAGENGLEFVATATPGAHHGSHENGGGDEISVAGLSGVLVDEQPSSWALVTGKPGTFTPSAHAASHQNGGGDEISVAGLSGVLADAQTPATHGNTVHSPKMVEVDGTEPLTADWDVGAHKVRAQSLQADGLTTGHVLFAGVAGLLSGEANLFWDASNNRLGIGIATPDQALHVNGNVVIGESVGIYLVGRGIIGGNPTGNWTAYFGQDATHSAAFGWVYDETPADSYARMVTYGYNNDFRVDAKNILFQAISGGKVGVKTTTPGTDLDVNGETWLRGNAGASLLSTSVTVTNSFQSWNLSSVVGARVALVLIEIRNATANDYDYSFAPSASVAYFDTDLAVERGTGQATVTTSKRGFVLVPTSSSGIVYFRSDVVQVSASTFVLVGFI